MNFYKRHIGDYLRDAGHLTLLEHGAYTRLLDVYYTREGAIPEEQAARLIGARTREERDAVDRVLAEFFELVDGAWTQRRCEREIEAATTKAERNREIGRRGGRPKKTETQTDTDTDTETEPRKNPDGFREEPNGNPSQTPDTRLHKPDKEERKDTRSARSAPPDRPGDVPEKVWNDFLAIRKAKRAPLTETALDGIAREAAKAGMTLPQALAKCCERGWQGFEAKWVEREAGAARGRESVSDFNRRSTEEALAMLGTNAGTIDA